MQAPRREEVSISNSISSRGDRLSIAIYRRAPRSGKLVAEVNGNGYRWYRSGINDNGHW